jgi:LCP family protein required for cell wall assembly
MDGGNRDGREDAGGRKRRPRWRYAALALAFLLLAELGLLAVVLLQFHSLGFFESLPIVQKPGQGAPASPPESLEPADGGDTGDQDGEDVGPAAGKVPIYAQAPIDTKVVNILVLGLDTRTPGGNGRSDINMIVSIDRKRKTIKLASLLRDTLVPIEGHGWNRLNSACAFGGPGLTINTINEVYKLDIQRYVKIDFFAIKDIIDAAGGVDVKLTDAEIAYLRSFGYNVSKGAGVKHLDGGTALAYARIRKIDGDFQRTQRQRNVLTAALNKARGMGVMKAIDLMTKLLPQVKTNVGTNEAIQLARDVLAMGGGEIKQMAVPVQGSYSNMKYKGMAILSVDFDKNADALKSFLYGD